MRGTGDRLHWLAVMSGFPPAASVAARLSRSLNIPDRNMRLGRGHGGRERRWNCIPDAVSCNAFQMAIDAADVFRVIEVEFGDSFPVLSPFETVTDASRPCCAAARRLLDRQQLVEHRIQVIDAGGKSRGNLVERIEQRKPSCVRVFLAKASLREAFGLVTSPQNSVCWAISSLFSRSSSGTSVAFARIRWPEEFQRAGQRRHLIVAQSAEILLRVGIHRLIRIDGPTGVGPIRAQIVHRLEQVRRRIRDHRHAIGVSGGAPGTPRAEQNRGITQSAWSGFTAFSSADTVKAIQHGGPQSDASHFA